MGLFGSSKGTSRVASQQRKRIREFSTPQVFQNLVQRFNPMFMSLLTQGLGSNINQALSGTRSQLSRRGLTGTGFGQATLAGIPALFQSQAAIQALMAAIQQANVSQATRINALLGSPLPAPSQGLLAPDISTAIARIRPQGIP